MTVRCPARVLANFMRIMIPETKTPSDLTPQIVKRVHELYEELGAKMFEPLKIGRRRS